MLNEICHTKAKHIVWINKLQNKLVCFEKEPLDRLIYDPIKVVWKLKIQPFFSVYWENGSCIGKTFLLCEFNNLIVFRLCFMFK